MSSRRFLGGSRADERDLVDEYTAQLVARAIDAWVVVCIRVYIRLDKGAWRSLGRKERKVTIYNVVEREDDALYIVPRGEDLDSGSRDR